MAKIPFPTAPGLSALAALFFLACMPFTAVAAAPSGGNFPEGTSEHAVVCYHESVGFMVSPPPGWVNHFITGERLGVCTVFIPEGTTFDYAPAIIYPRAVERIGGGTLEETARLQAEATQRQLSGNRAGAGPEIVKGPLVPTNAGNTFALWLFNEGPPPNEWEAAAYLPKDDVLLILVLSARNLAARDNHLADLEAVARDVLTFKIRKK